MQYKEHVCGCAATLMHFLGKQYADFVSEWVSSFLTAHQHKKAI